MDLFPGKKRKGPFAKTRGIPRDWLIEPWSELVLIIQKYFTCIYKEWKYEGIYRKYEKVKAAIYKEWKYEGIYFLLQVEEATGLGTAGTSSLRRSKQKRQA